MFPTNTFTFIEGDICNSRLLDKIIPGHDAVINFAAESHVDRSIHSSAEFVTTNVEGTEKLLRESMHSGVKTFLQISTDEVYGSIINGAWNEDSNLEPNSPYSASKASADMFARSYYKTYGFDTRITRSSNNYGPYQFPEKVIPLFITNLIEGKKVPIYGTGENVRDWIHVDDNCRGIHSVLINGKPGMVYNLGGGEEIRNIDLAAKILELMNIKNDAIENVQDRKGHDFRYAMDCSLARKEIGFLPSIDFETGLRSTINWYIKNQNWWRSLVTN